MRELSQLVGRERTRAFIQRTVDAAGLDLSPGSAWLLVQCAEGRTGDPDALAADRGIDAGWIRAELGALDERGLVGDGAPTDEGRATVQRLLEARRDCLTALVADWEPDEDPRINDAIERLAQELAQETPEVPPLGPKSHCEPDHVSLKVAIDRFPDRRLDMKITRTIALGLVIGIALPGAALAKGGERRRQRRRAAGTRVRRGSPAAAPRAPAPS